MEASCCLALKNLLLMPLNDSTLRGPSGNQHFRQLNRFEITRHPKTAKDILADNRTTQRTPASHQWMVLHQIQIETTPTPENRAQDRAIQPEAHHKKHAPYYLPAQPIYLCWSQWR